MLLDDTALLLWKFSPSTQFKKVFSSKALGESLRESSRYNYFSV